MKRSDLIDLLPDNYKELCWENGAMTRHRGIQNEEELIMLVLFYALGHSLVEVKNYAKIEFNRNISDGADDRQVVIIQTKSTVYHWFYIPR